MLTDQSIIKRLEILEKQNRRFKRFGAAGIVIVASFLLMGQARTPRRVEANEFVLLDSKGKVRSTWTVMPDRAALDFMDDNGLLATAISYYSAGGGGSIMLSGRNGTSIYN